MATGVLTRNKVDAIRGYFRRQFVTEEGGLEEALRCALCLHHEMGLGGGIRIDRDAAHVLGTG
jgi:hypothetical protein